MKAKIIVTLYIKNVTGALYTVNYNPLQKLKENKKSVSFGSRKTYKHKLATQSPKMWTSVTNSNKRHVGRSS